MEKKVIVMFGGAFNPPTNAHFALAQAIVDTYSEVVNVLFVPVGDTYYKKDLAPAHYRLSMLNSVCELNKTSFAVSDVEITATRCLKTVETLDILKSKYEFFDIWFVIGSDNLKDLSNWVMAEELLERHEVLVMERMGDSVSEIILKSPLFSNYKEKIKVLEGVSNPISSTLIRDKLKKNHSVKFLVPDKVIEIIEENKLYCEERS